MALAKKTRQTRTASGSTLRVRASKTSKRPRKNAPTEKSSERSLNSRIEDYLTRSGTRYPKFLQRIHAQAKKNGLDKLTMREIDAMIKETRKELRLKQK